MLDGINSGRILILLSSDSRLFLVTHFHPGGHSLVVGRDHPMNKIRESPETSHLINIRIRLVYAGQHEEIVVVLEQRTSFPVFC